MAGSVASVPLSMNSRSNPLVWSFSLGTWFSTRVRVSWFLPVVFAWFVFEFGWPMGGALSGVLFVTILLHEFSHIAMARSLGVDGDEILIWPLGGLAFVGGGATPGQNLLISGAGPFSNLLICLATLYPVLTSPHALASFNPLVLPIGPAEFSQNVLVGLSLVTFSINWMLLLLNLLPVMPLDGGAMTRSMLVLRLGQMIGIEASIRLGMFLGLGVILVAALFLRSPILVGLGSFFVIYAILEHQQSQVHETADDSFMGYDFSQGYTSLKKSAVKDEPEPRPGFFERWRKRREEARARRESERDQQAIAQLDALLAKVHENGLESLTEAEKRLLKQASDRLRSNRKLEG